KHLLPKLFNWFYFSINAGSALSTLLIPWLLNPYKVDPNGSIAKMGPSVVSFLESPRLHSPDVAFGLPGIFMAIATLFFWAGRKKFVHIPPVGWQPFFDDTVPRERQKPFLILFFPLAVFSLTVGLAALFAPILGATSASEVLHFNVGWPITIALVLLVAVVIWAIRPVLRYILIPVPFAAMFWAL